MFKYLAYKHILPNDLCHLLKIRLLWISLPFLYLYSVQNVLIVAYFCYICWAIDYWRLVWCARDEYHSCICLFVCLFFILQFYFRLNCLVYFYCRINNRTSLMTYFFYLLRCYTFSHTLRFVKSIDRKHFSILF